MPGHLSDIAALGQIAQQLDRFIRLGLEAGRLADDVGRDPAVAISQAHDAVVQIDRETAALIESVHKAVALSTLHGGP